MDSAIIWNTNTKNIHKCKKLMKVENKNKRIEYKIKCAKKNKCAGQYTVDLINNHI